MFTFFNPEAGHSFYGGTAAVLFPTIVIFTIFVGVAIWMHRRPDDCMLIFDRETSNAAPVTRVLAAVGFLLLYTAMGAAPGVGIGCVLCSIIYSYGAAGIAIDIALGVIVGILYRANHHRIALIMDGVKVGDMDQE
jgi:hypothetical protein